ncbi:MAG: NAD(P)H-quinone oxidoreductase [Rhodospirillaceae bacterium]|nr:NAD(P)H-quinone oxidoreductase [Rhodospirillaceae bacterium]MBT5565515.1 NAD(P)H-quinone oxidoreductase [Rhodospirillaceae bacterium]MBT6089845.1 NAD(P)H-quinone oxidoreductase [Rhodospirillaceae bacterium]MBT6961431.1 NAD(P)H-quinone oxidoreductase [Rhodospirillaceae bacterium]
MRCVEITKPGGPDVLVETTRPLPDYNRDQVLIKVSAAGVNRPDVLQRLGQYPPPDGASDLPGLEVSGIIAAVGEDVDAWKVGDHICSLLTGGGYAEYAASDAVTCMPIPAGLNVIDAAALPETVFTVWHNVFDRSQLQPGESLLVHGGTSGIGTTAIQMAKAHGCEVVVTAGSDEKCQACLDLGADIAINYRDQDFVSIIRDRPKKGVDVILDMVGGEYIAKNLKCLRPDGRLAFIAFLGGSKAEIDFMPLMLKRLTISGSTLRSRPLSVKESIAKSVTETVWPWIEKGQFRPKIDRILSLTKASEAHQIMESSSHIGKILLNMETI